MWQMGKIYRCYTLELDANKEPKMKICFLITTRGNVAKTESIRVHLEGRVDLSYILGGSVKEVPPQGISRHIFIINEGTLRGTYKSAGIITMEAGTILEELKPDMMVIVGDRFECLPVAMIAAYMNIPIAHIEGGEVSGSIDENIRHAITKLSHLHFPCTNRAKDRIIRLGEHPDNVFNFGSTSIDMLRKYEDNESPIKGEYIVVIYHPISNQMEDIDSVVAAIFSGYSGGVVWIAPNIDTHANLINLKLHTVNVVEGYSPKEYAPLIKNAMCVVGNSSSGIRDTPFFGIPAVNIGDRQSGREKPFGVIDVPVYKEAISEAIKCQIGDRYTPNYTYGDGHAGEKIADKILTHKVNIQKAFYDMGNYTSKSG